MIEETSKVILKRGARPASVRSLLLWLMLACLLPGMLGATAILYYSFLNQRAQLVQNTNQTTRALMQAVDAEFGRIQALTQALAVSEHLASNDLAAFHAQALGLVPLSKFDHNYVLSDANGQQLVNTLRPYPSTLPLRNNLEVVRQVFSTGQPSISGLTFGRVRQQHVMTVDVPVWRNGQVLYVLSFATVPTAFLGEVLKKQQLPPDWVVSFFDAQGTIAFRSHKADKFVGQKIAPALLARLPGATEGMLETNTLEGIPVSAVFSRSLTSNWGVVIGIPTQSLTAELYQRFAWLAAGLSGMLALGVVLAQTLAGRIGGSIRALTAPALALGNGEAVTVPRVYVCEAEELGEAIVMASKLLLSAEQRRSAAEQVRHHQQAEMNGIINSAMDALIMIDSAQRVVLFNPAAEKMFGRHASDIVGTPLEVLLPQRFQAGHAAHIDAFGRTGTTARRMGGLGVITGLRANGEEFPIEASISQLDVNGDKYFTVILRDVTERKGMEANLRVAAIAFEAQLGIFITNANGVILRVNRMFTEDTGYSAEEAIGQTPRMLKSGRHDAAFYEAMWECLRRAGIWQGEIWDRRKNGEIYPKWIIISAVKDDDGVVTHYVGTQTDITQRKAAEEEITLLAFYDPLTRLPNRRLLQDRMHQAMATSARSRQQGALFFIDLDNFKTLNDTLGHDLGDLLLQQVADRLSACVREGDTVARLGGDEFVIILEGLSPHRNEAADQAGVVGELILAKLNQNHRLLCHDYHDTPSIGVTLFSDQRVSLEELLKQADLAMYQAKAAGRNTLRFFDPKMQAAVNAHVLLETELRQAVRDGQFVLYYQAQTTHSGRVTGAEILVRWQHPLRGLVPPNDFIALAEETGLILPMGHWVLKAACFQLAAWATQPDAADLTLAVNVSVHQLRLPDFVAQVLSILECTGAEPCKLKLEMTESLLMDNIEDAIAKMTALKAIGVRFALDDFGTGFSSLAYLKRLPLERLKIDRSFVMDVNTDQNYSVIAKTIVELAHGLGIDVIAEGVENEEQRAVLARHGCHAYQGYLFSRPLPLQAFEALVKECNSISVTTEN